VQALRVQIPQVVVRRITNRCSGPGHIKCSAAGVDSCSSPHRHRARVLIGWRAAAELSR
jgi:hypothetical protein